MNLTMNLTMNSQKESRSREKPAFKSGAYFVLAALLAMTAATAQVAMAAGETGIDASGSFSLEMRACASGQTQQDRETCMREARNAQADKRRGELEAGGRFEANAAARCDALSGEDKAACQARVFGYGSASGSVAGGGVIREVETVVLPEGASEVSIEPRASNPVLLVPIR